jgi:signal transduction histidine kinase/CheY-like chemotaxis protein
MRIRTRLLVLVLAILIPAFLVAAFGIGYVYREAQQANRKSLQEATRALALLVDHEIGSREGILQSLADSPALDHGDLATFYRHAQKTAGSLQSTIVLNDPSGKVLMNTAFPFGAKNIIKAGIFDELRERHGPDDALLSNLYISPNRKTPSIAIQLPVKRNGRILYYLAMGTSASQFQSIMANQRMPSTWIGSIINRDGVIVARTHEPQEYVGKRAREGLLKKISETHEGMHRGITLNGMATFASFSLAPKSGWTFVVNVPRHEVRNAALRATLFAGSVALVLFGVALIVGIIFARRTVGPIEALRLSAEQLGRGKAIVPKFSGIRELDEVAAAMAQASTDIRNGKAELERRVEEAVATTERSQRALLQSQKLEALGRLTGGIAHDFNNVLQTITSGLQLAQISSTDTRIKSLTATCLSAVDRAVELTRKLMVFGRVQDARLETIGLTELLHETIPLLKSGLRSNIAFRLRMDDVLWPVTLDKLQFELALLNLAINARDAMPQGGVLEVEARNETVSEPRDEMASGDYVCITVSDSGEGMSTEVMAKAFDPFFTTKDVGKGSGLGLPQAYGFAKQSGGLLLLRSQPGKGTQAILYLPRAERPAAPANGELNTPQPLRLASGTVLFVEDDPLVKDVVEPALQAAGFHVRAARHGEEAVQILESGERIDFIFSDIVMPGSISGIDLAELVRKRYPGIPMLLASGYSNRRVSLPNVRILAKPYSVDEVIAALLDQQSRN